MCRVMEELRNESLAEGRAVGRAEGCAEGRNGMAREIIEKMAKQGWTAQQIAQTLGFDLEMVKNVLTQKES